MVSGNCALCPQKSVELKESHILSKFGYKRLRDSNLKNPNPMQVTSGKSVQTSKQITMNLLCFDCEQKLGNGCEKYIAEEISYRENGDCPLYNKFGYTSKVTSVLQPPERHIVDCSSLNIDYILQFAVSIFWRSALFTRGTMDPFKLNNSILDLLRDYLQNPGNQLQDIPISMTVIDQPRGLSKKCFHRIMMLPGTKDLDSFRLHGFLFCGLYFTLAEGSDIPNDFYVTSLFHSSPKYFSFTGAMHLGVIHSLIDSVLDAN